MFDKRMQFDAKICLLGGLGGEKCNKFYLGGQKPLKKSSLRGKSQPNKRVE
jgi:hypothetical protein